MHRDAGTAIDGAVDDEVGTYLFGTFVDPYEAEMSAGHRSRIEPRAVVGHRQVARVVVDVPRHGDRVSRGMLCCVANRLGHDRSELDGNGAPWRSPFVDFDDQLQIVRLDFTRVRLL